MGRRRHRKHEFVPHYNIEIEEQDLTLYHLSERTYDSRAVIYPRIPSNYLTENHYENTKTPRICAAHSIDSCLIALHQNLVGRTFHVYTIDRPFRSMYPTIRDVPDVEITNEVWVLDPVHLSYIGDIKIISTIDTPVGTYEIPDHPPIALYQFEWEWR